MEATTTTPIFKSAKQALHVAFALEVTAMAHKGATAILIQDLMKQRYGSGWSEKKDDLDLDLGSLSPIEFRAQCASIRKIVQGKLTELQRDCIWARYAFQKTQLDGIAGVLEFFRTLCNTKNDKAVEALVMAIYLGQNKRSRHEYSLRKIELKFDIKRSVLHRDQQLVKVAAGRIEERAVFELDFMLGNAGLIATE